MSSNKNYWNEFNGLSERKLQGKLEHLYLFNQTSNGNYDTVLQLAANITTGLAEVQSGKDFYAQLPLLCIIKLSESYNYMLMETVL